MAVRDAASLLVGLLILCHTWGGCLVAPSLNQLFSLVSHTDSDVKMMVSTRWFGVKK
ncbi:hypothetical protein D9C73_015163 [Collichthys lucidus]|uniref:Uncharacterized protein n=1 Tax=Collichthys lucidus TaxID=240159 RepID=A0A4U5V0K6_COLLU|nr:hypothetical protein D9C73_015163 [Collichthys lucidus]